METSTGQQVQSTQAARMSTLNRPLVFPILRRLLLGWLRLAGCGSRQLKPEAGRPLITTCIRQYLS